MRRPFSNEAPQGPPMPGRAHLGAPPRTAGPSPGPAACPAHQAAHPSGSGPAWNPPSALGLPRGCLKTKTAEQQRDPVTVRTQDAGHRPARAGPFGSQGAAPQEPLNLPSFSHLCQFPHHTCPHLYGAIAPSKVTPTPGGTTISGSLLPALGEPWPFTSENELFAPDFS